MGNILKSLGFFLVSKKYRSIVLATLVMLFLGTIIFHFTEGWRWFDSFYFCVITLATVGYGDFTPKTDLGKIAVIFYIISGIGIFLAFVQAYFEFIKENRKKP
ncbi:MAG: potassium channel family protein [Candidatus Moraniibacteriota bacterium]